MERSKTFQQGEWNQQGSTNQLGNENWPWWTERRTRDVVFHSGPGMHANVWDVQDPDGQACAQQDVHFKSNRLCVQRGQVQDLICRDVGKNTWAVLSSPPRAAGSVWCCSTRAGCLGRSPRACALWHSHAGGAACERGWPPDDVVGLLSAMRRPQHWLWIGVLFWCPDSMSGGSPATSNQPTAPPLIACVGLESVLWLISLETVVLRR